MKVIKFESESKKEAIKEKMNAGKEWIKKNKTIITFGLGMISTYLFLKIFTDPDPNNCGIRVLSEPDFDGENFMIRTYAKNRFGQTLYYGPWVRFEDGLESKERIDTAIMKAINNSNKS